MANKMLIDATHPEETRVVVLRGNRVEEFDFESAQRKQLRGNIYLAKVTRVEPSLQAAFVDYGGNRHGFLAFSEIHPDYYQIPVADRQALIDEEGRAARAADDEAERRSHRNHRRGGSSAARRGETVVQGDIVETGERSETSDQISDEQLLPPDGEPLIDEPFGNAEHPDAAAEPESFVGTLPATFTTATEYRTPPEAEVSEADPAATATSGEPAAMPSADSGFDLAEPTAAEPAGDGTEETAAQAPAPIVSGDENGAAEHHDGDDEEHPEEIIESVGGADALEEVPDRAPRHRRQYKIQEVIKRRQVMLVQVVKEERGTKGAALTTYLSLAGRYCVLMPNTARGGGISRKITSADDRSRLKEIAQELEVPEGMGVILRTAGASRTKTEIKRDFEYLLRMWETVRDLTLRSTAPRLVYEEGSLVKRSIRDLYTKDIDEVIVAGTEAYQEAKDFMRMLMPSHAKNVKPYTETQPLLSRFGVENQLDAMFSPVVQLRSGGYIVLNQAEALVAIDVNSGRATREHHIEDTALKTNLEAADEIARQLRLRDLAGLIVIDFIDMDENRNNRSVERRLKECLKQDRARIQVGRISHFGLLEMSRQRIRASVLESSTEKCPYCGGSGHVRSVSSLALQVLRALEENLMKGGTHNLIARTRPDVALYVLNQKRAHLRALEERFVITITISADATIAAPQAFAIDRGELVHTVEAARAIAAQAEAAKIIAPLDEDDELEDLAAFEDEDAEEAAAAEPAAAEPDEGGGGRRRRRRRRRGRGGNDAAQPSLEATADEAGEPAETGDEEANETDGGEETPEGALAERGEQLRDGERRRRRRGRRGGRRNRVEREGSERDSEGATFPGEGIPYEGPANNPEEAFAETRELSERPRAEPVLEAAVADLDATPPRSPETEQELAEPPRRRSTVRERAPIAGSGEQPQPGSPQPSAPEPVITDVGDNSDGDKPRRSGWWSRRFG
jgi:ribonuclease E